MEVELSHSTLQIIAVSKIILVLLLAGIGLAWRFKAKAWQVGIGLTVVLAAFTFTVLDPLKTMFFGTVGDELFVTAFFMQVMSDSPLQDFYYHGLPTFYPPLYFWIVGLIAKPFASNAIMAAKIGVLMTSLMWFMLPYTFMKLAVKKEGHSIAKNPWVWLLPPALFLLAIDFDSFILKPYETTTAVMLTYIIGIFGMWLKKERWTLGQRALLGITAAATFLSYYFWWFIIIPALFVLALLSENKGKAITRILMLGAIMVGGVSIYLAPLVLTLLEQGMQNWQAHFFIPHDFSTFIPWGMGDGRALLYLVGVAGLWVYKKDNFIKANGILMLTCYGYQVLNIVMYLGGGSPLQSVKPMLFLSTAATMIGAAALCIKFFEWLKESEYKKHTLTALIVLGVLLIGQTPMVRFIDDEGIREYLENGQKETSVIFLSESIKKEVTEPEQHMWLSSGMPELNAYIPLKYFLAHSPHFSHQAAIYTKRLKAVYRLTEQTDPQKFTDHADNLKINALLMYKEYSEEEYPLIFWQDNYPNGGKELLLELPKDLITEEDWNIDYEDNEWAVFIRRN